MANVEDTVRSVVADLIKGNELFTALDVSNKVKLQLPFARHREVREIVRNLFSTDIETQGWVRTPIAVTLADGRQETALLYHPASDSWDIDNKYDTQKRNQVSLSLVAQAAVSVGSASPSVPAPVVAAPAPVAAPVVPAPVQTARQQWDSLFKTQPSLFPSR